MSVRTFLLAILALALLGLAALWLSRPKQVAVPPTIDGARANSEGPSPPSEPLSLSKSEERAPATPPATVAVWTPSPEDLVGAQWVEGRVLIPPGLPAGESITLEAQGRAFRGGGRHSVALGPDGAFRLAFPKDSTTGRLHLVSRFLFLDEPRFKLPYAGGAFDLRAELRGALQGRITLSETAEPQRHALAGARVRLWSKAWLDSPEHKGVSPEVELGQDGSFEFDGVPAASDWELTLPAGEFTQSRRVGIVVELAKSTQVDLPTQLCARLQGRVVDESGAPVPGAKFEHLELTQSEPKRMRCKQVSGPDGAFELKGIPLGRGQLSTSLPGFLADSRPLEELSEGAVVEGLEILLRRGESIVGKVSWPDGQPAAAARVVAAFLDGQPIGQSVTPRSRSQHTRTDAEGHFRIEGLPKSALRVCVSAVPQDAVLSERQQHDPAELATAEWNALLELDDPGAEPLALVLAQPCALRGRVIDTAGNPVVKFNVQIEPLWRVQVDPQLNAASTMRSFENRDGSFVIGGLFRTAYEISAFAAFVPPSTRRRVELPGTIEPIELVLASLTEVSGLVLDPNGAPVEGARIRSDGSNFRGIQTDASGRFLLEHVTAGSLEMRAEARGWAPSKPLRIEVSTGRSSDGHVLHLRVPGRIVGEVLDAEGRPESGRPIDIGAGDPARLQHSDASGRFVFEDLVEGDYWLRTRATDAEIAAGVPGSKQRLYSVDPLERQGHVKLAEGETARVVLKPPSELESPILVKGRVGCGGKPVAGCEVMALPRSGAGSRVRTATSAGDGSFQLRLDGSGLYGFELSPPGAAAETERTVSIEPGKVAEVLLELPAGHLSGSTVDREGRLVPGVRLELHPDSWNSGAEVRGSRGSIQSDAQGRFQFEHVASGSYAITGTDGRASSARHGKTTHAGFVVREPGSLEDVRFVLLPGCRVEGIARRPDGQPASGAKVFVREQSGEMLSESWSVDPSGQFVVDGLPPGRYSFQALSEHLASAETASIALGDAETFKLDLALRESTDLYVQVLDANGNAGYAMLRMIDDAGRDKMLTLRLDERTEEPTDPPAGRRIGPIPPGKYTLRAEWPDGGTVTRELSFSGERTVALTLRPAN